MPGSTTCYGVCAAHFANAPDAPFDVVVVDATGIAEATADCIQRKAQNRPFLARVLLADRHAHLVEALAAQVVQSASTFDQRRIYCERLAREELTINGTAMRSLSAFTPAALAALRNIVYLSEGLAVSCETERRRVCEALGVDPPAVRLAFTDPTVPTPSAPALERKAIVIWAPHLRAETVAFYATALHEFHTQVIAVTAAGEVQDTSVTWVSGDKSQEALRRAAVILDVNALGVDSAVALSGWDAPLATNAASGAHEVLDNVRTFSLWDFSSISKAIYAAMGESRPAVRGTLRAESFTPRKPQVAGPLASILIATRNRRDLLRIALESISRQTYENVEAVVVNDAGEDVSDVVKSFPFARLITNAQNTGVAVALNTAFRHAAGEYVGILGDDDLLFPDHITTLCSALRAGHGAVAHGNVLTCYLRPRGNDLECYGAEGAMILAMDRSELLVTNRLGVMSVLFRRDAIEGALLDEQTPLNRDYELWMRLSQRYDFIHVDRFTSCYTIRPSDTQMSVEHGNKNAEAHRYLYARYSADERPSIAARRTSHLSEIEARQGLPQNPPLECLPFAWPPSRSTDNG